MNTSKMYFSTERFNEGQCQLNFNVKNSNNIELLIPSKLWDLLDSKTSVIDSVDIESNTVGISVNFVDGDRHKPYTVSVSLEQTNLSDANFDINDISNMAKQVHNLKVYTEVSNEPVAEFDDVGMLRFAYKETKQELDAWINR